MNSISTIYTYIYIHQMHNTIAMASLTSFELFSTLIYRWQRVQIELNTSPTHSCKYIYICIYVSKYIEYRQKLFYGYSKNIKYNIFSTNSCCNPNLVVGLDLSVDRRNGGSAKNRSFDSYYHQHLPQLLYHTIHTFD